MEQVDGPSMEPVTDWDHTNYCGVFGGVFLAAIPTGSAIIERLCSKALWVSPSATGWVQDFFCGDGKEGIRTVE